MEKTPEKGAFQQLVETRCSCRRFDSRPVPVELLGQCLEAARQAPSACNAQPWRFVIVRNPQTREQLCSKALLPGIKHEWLQDAPVIIAVCAQLNVLTHRIAPAVSGIPYYLIDLGIAGEHLVLAATELGLGSCWIGWFNERQARRILRIPRQVRVLSLLALGYPLNPVAGRCTVRKPLDEICFNDSWDHAGFALKPE